MISRSRKTTNGSSTVSFGAVYGVWAVCAVTSDPAHTISKTTVKNILFIVL